MTSYCRPFPTTNNNNELITYIDTYCFTAGAMYDINRIENFIKEHKHLINVPNTFNLDIVIQTISHNKYDILELLIKYGADLTRRYGPKKYTPLMNAIHQQRDSCVFMLIKYTKDLEVRDHNGNTALLNVVICGDQIIWFEVINELLENGADIYAQNDNGQNILHIAILKNDYNLIQFLIEKKMYLNMLNNDKQNILYQQVLGGKISFEVLKLLAENGANFDEEDNDGKTLSDILISEIANQETVYKYVCRLNEGELNRQCWFFKYLVILFEYGASLCISNNVLDKLLILATHMDDKKYIEILVEHGAKIQPNKNTGPKIYYYHPI